MTENVQYPAQLLNGDVITTCYQAIFDALQKVMPDNGMYRYVPITPRPTETQWRAFTGKAPAIGIGWAGWHASKLDGKVFRGPLLFSVALLTEHREANRLYVGDGQLPGIFGVTAAAIAMLNGMTVDGAGTAFVVSASNTDLAQFLSDGQASALLTVQFDNVALNVSDIVGQLDTLKILNQKYMDSRTGAEL